MKHLHSGHRERIRKRIKEFSLDSLQDHEVLEWLLFHTLPREDVNALAHRLIHHFGSFYGVLEATYEDLLAVDGVGEITAVFLSNLLAVEGRYHQSKQKQNVRKFRDLEDIHSYLKVAFVSMPREELHALFLDKDMHLIRDVAIANGTYAQVEVDLRLLTTHCLNTKAVSVVLAHNHPSDFLLPSSQDVHQTTEVAQLLNRLKVNLLDHVIVGSNDTFSMKSSREYSYLFY